MFSKLYFHWKRLIEKTIKRRQMVGDCYAFSNGTQKNELVIKFWVQICVAVYFVLTKKIFEYKEGNIQIFDQLQYCSKFYIIT